MNVHVLVNLLNELGEKIRCEALPGILLGSTWGLMKSVIWTQMQVRI